MQKVALVTGVTSELGSSIVKNLSNSCVVYAAARDINSVAKGKNIRPVRLDITKGNDCKEVVEKVIKEQKKIDILVNCAGYTIVGPSLGFSTEDFLAILDTNTIGAFRLIKQVVPHMIERSYGRIINITSMNGLVTLPNFGLYSASKHALEALGLSIRYELSGKNVWVTNVAPGAIFSKSDKSYLTNPPEKNSSFFIIFYQWLHLKRCRRKYLKLSKVRTLLEG